MHKNQVAKVTFWLRTARWWRWRWRPRPSWSPQPSQSPQPWQSLPPLYCYEYAGLLNESEGVTFCRLAGQTTARVYFCMMPLLQREGGKKGKKPGSTAACTRRGGQWCVRETEPVAVESCKTSLGQWVKATTDVWERGEERRGLRFSFACAT